MTADKLTENGLLHAKLIHYENEYSDWSQSGLICRNADR